jgi:NAD(P)-dependent dehydrogenase (short-subunit alcohol dehydrogenase family)
LTDKVAIITGGSRGIGRATAIAAAARGFRVCIGYVSNESAANEVVAAIEAKNGKAIAVKCDVGQESDILALFNAADAFGTLGALVNNAGIVGPTARVEDMPAERIQRRRATAARAASSSIFPRSPPSLVRPIPMSITRRRKALSIHSRSGSAMKSPARGFASRRSGPG